MDIRKNPAIWGIWEDYTTRDIFLSVRDPWGIIIIAVGGIWLSWSLKYIKKIVGNFVLWFHLEGRKTPRHTENASPARSPSQNTDDDGTATEHTELLERGPELAPAEDRQALAKAYKETTGVRDLFWKSTFGNELNRGDKIRLFFFTGFVAALASGMLVLGYFTVKIRSNGPAKLASDRCGLWIFDGERRSEAATRARLLDLENEERAAQYARNCYSATSGFHATQCNFFYRRKLPLTDSSPIWTNDCPFQNDICLQNQTVTFATPLIDASDIGINSDITPKFRRNTTCTPLNMDYPFIRNKTENGTTTYYYYYGTKHGDDTPVEYTYKTVGDPWDRLAPVYDVFAYSSNADDSDDSVWQPRSELTHPKYSTLTLMFVSSLRILYKERSNDPIFPADAPWSVPGDPKPWFRNSDPRARPLACINTIEACAPNGKTCWNINSPSGPNATDNTPEFSLLYASLYRTDIYYSLAKRQGRALLAQQVVSQYFSEALDDYHWVDEIRSLFETALARTQINAWSVASGEDSIHEGKDGYISVTKDYDDLCERYKYNPQGYQSLHFIPLMVILAIVPFLMLLSLDCGSTKQKKARDNSATEGVSPVPVGAGPPGTAATPPPARSSSEATRNATAQEPSSTHSTMSDDEKIKWEPIVLSYLVFGIPQLITIIVERIRKTRSSLRTQGNRTSQTGTEDPMQPPGDQTSQTGTQSPPPREGDRTSQTGAQSPTLSERDRTSQTRTQSPAQLEGDQTNQSETENPWQS